MDNEEPLLDGWLPLTEMERLELEVRALWIAWDFLRAEVEDLKAWFRAVEAYRARDEER